MPRIDQKLVNSPINTPSMAIDGAIDAIDAINGHSFRRSMHFSRAEKCILGTLCAGTSGHSMHFFGGKKCIVCTEKSA